MNLKPFVMIIGGPNSGKSTIISSLTGCDSSTYRNLIIDYASNKKIWVIASSPQEDPLNRMKFANILRSVRQERDIIGIIIAIQPTKPWKRLSLEYIVQKAQTAGNFNIFAFVLDPPYEDGEVTDVNRVSNRLANLGVVIHFLDGRRFAFLNAMEIKTITGIP